MNRHLDDGAFSEIWTKATADGAAPADPHLNACAQCRARYASFTNWLDDLRDEAHAEADEAFTAERLAAQQAHVLRRLETLERPARIIAFPRFARPVTSTQGNAQRWVAAAAAAGLVIGLAAGQFVDIRHRFVNTAPAPANMNARLNTAPARPPVAAQQPTSSVSDEALFLGGADSTQGLVRVSTLQPMDAITPRARDLELSR